MPMPNDDREFSRIHAYEYALRIGYTMDQAEIYANHRWRETEDFEDLSELPPHSDSIIRNLIEGK